MHKRCSKIRDRLQGVKDFQCKNCEGKELGVNQVEEIVVNCGGVKLEVVDKFCY